MARPGFKASKCTSCGKKPDEVEFHKGATQCKLCRRKLYSEWRASHKPETIKYSKNWVININNKVFDILGRKCAECFETTQEFLTVDHIHHDRQLERSSNSYAWKLDIINGKVDRNRYQTLCRNCNDAKQRKTQFVKIKTPTGVLKTCNSCLNTMDVSEYYSNGSGSVKSRCAVCVKNSNTVTMLECYRLLGNKCVCCGEDDPYMLNVDHVNNDGGVRRTLGDGIGKSIYKKIVMLRISHEGLQLLCSNCNYSKMRNRFCIHTLMTDNKHGP